eukprot:Gregarina_sp_Poly_1__84@NODE_1019_length_5335_cov_515_001708_g710_i0_p5_GENE_NODE_1019_length_5335_cov_515_001708_g710_i0NODE_1019_length_5335_cov_515_001708_g710_i0_p5_ORF_typecomplete_len123_score13_14_NODE_1019_length_5335_cov_515_001708_g710_i0582950
MASRIEQMRNTWQGKIAAWDEVQRVTLKLLRFQQSFPEESAYTALRNSFSGDTKKMKKLSHVVLLASGLGLRWLDQSRPLSVPPEFNSDAFKQYVLVPSPESLQTLNILLPSEVQNAEKYFC